MPGKAINSEQVRVYMETRKEGRSQVTASAQAGISERSGRRIENGALQAGSRRKRSWRTRVDPFVGVWDSEVLPMLEKNHKLTPITLFEKLQKDHPGEYQDSKLRTFQRRVSEWRALSGPDKEVMFRQEQVVGRMGLSDFTQIKEVTITIQGTPFKHLLYHFRLAFSGWCSVKIVHGGESYTALAEGLQDALWRLGGVPQEHRSDSLSAAYRNLSKDAAEDTTRRYRQLCHHYGMEATRNNRGKGHENGAIESPHGHLKKRLKQGLLLRDSNDFSSEAAYAQFLAEIVSEINSRKLDKINQERQYLQPLPLYRTAAYTETVVPVSTTSTIRIKRILYTVPSRLIGERLRVHIYDSRLEAYLGSTLTITLPRAFVSDNNHRGRQVDYRHVIRSLEKKPQAFRYSQIREDLLPDQTYKAVWAWLDKEMEARKACKTMVGILALAHRADCEARLGEYLQELMASSTLPSLLKLQNRFESREQRVPEIKINQPPASDYDSLLSCCLQGVN